MESSTNAMHDEAINGEAKSLIRDSQFIEILVKLIDNKQTNEFIMICDEYQDIDLNQCCQSGWNPLHFASYLGNGDVVKYLLAKEKVDPNVVTKDMFTALHLAILNENIEISQILCENSRVDLNISPEDVHGTPLFNAAVVGIYGCNAHNFDCDQITHK